MDNGSDHGSRVRVYGRTEMKALADKVLAALEQADLTEELHLLHHRVFSLGPDALFDTTGAADESHWRFKPMIELLLLHVHDVAIGTGSAHDRQHEIRWAVQLAGF